jgi:hypothetical protein
MWKICIIALQQRSQLQWTTWSFVRKGKSMSNIWYYKEWKTVRKALVWLKFEGSNKNNYFSITKAREGYFIDHLMSLKIFKTVLQRKMQSLCKTQSLGLNDPQKGNPRTSKFFKNES